MDVSRLADEIEAELAAAGSDGRAEKERAYLKSELRHLGTSVPATRAVVKAFARKNEQMEHDEVVALAEALWAVPVHERRMAPSNCSIYGAVGSHRPICRCWSVCSGRRGRGR